MNATATATAQNNQTIFRALRAHFVAKGVVSPRCREVAPYVYSKNGGTPRAREVGNVAIQIWKMAYAHCLTLDASYMAMPRGSRSGRWRRTVSSQKAESRGTKRFWATTKALIDLGILVLE
jgi:hypothetical protein